VLSGRGLCDELITRPEESYRLRCVVVRDLETSRMRRPWPALGRSVNEKTKTLHLVGYILEQNLRKLLHTKSANKFVICVHCERNMTSCNCSSSLAVRRHGTSYQVRTSIFYKKCRFSKIYSRYTSRKPY